MTEFIKQPTNYRIDPERDGIDTAIWKTLSGTIALEGGSPDEFIFNEDYATTTLECIRGIFEFAVEFPLTGSQDPSDLVDNIEFGLHGSCWDGFRHIKLLADKTAGTLTFRTTDDLFNEEVTTITWNDAFNGDLVVFTITWNEDRILLHLLGDGGSLSQFVAEHTNHIPTFALNPYVKVDGAENFNIQWITLKNVHQLTRP